MIEWNFNEYSSNTSSVGSIRYPRESSESRLVPLVSLLDGAREGINFDLSTYGIFLSVLPLLFSCSDSAFVSVSKRTLFVDTSEIDCTVSGLSSEVVRRLFVVSPVCVRPLSEVRRTRRV